MESFLNRVVDKGDVTQDKIPPIEDFREEQDPLLGDEACVDDSVIETSNTDLPHDNEISSSDKKLEENTSPDSFPPSDEESRK